MTKPGSAVKSLSFFFLGVLVFFAFRWGAYEPFVIPSGSMIPTLLINDHILVAKYAYGLRWPFTDNWMTGPEVPKRGDVVVFRSVKDANFFMVKRVVGLPGDTISIQEDGGLLLNGEVIPAEPLSFTDFKKLTEQEYDRIDLRRSPDFTKFVKEKFGDHQHVIMLDQNNFDMKESFEVPEGHLFVMGDNRHSSQDSRFWGSLPLENLLGKATSVWLSCQKGVRSQQVFCDPRHIRWQRFFYTIQ